MAGELITREALDRIIQRAAELQTGERDIGDGLTEAEVVKLGGEVGIPAVLAPDPLSEVPSIGVLFVLAAVVMTAVAGGL